MKITKLEADKGKNFVAFTDAVEGTGFNIDMTKIKDKEEFKAVLKSKVEAHLAKEEEEEQKKIKLEDYKSLIGEEI